MKPESLRPADPVGSKPPLKPGIRRGAWLGIVLLLFFACDRLPNPFEEKAHTDRNANRPPETFLILNFPPEVIDTLIIDTMRYDSLSGDSILTRDTIYQVIRQLPDTTTSVQVLHWWGNDPDGEVVGYYYRWDFQSEWNYTDQEQDTFFLPLLEAYAEFTFQVKAVDDSGAVDPTPATLRLPVANQPPSIEFVPGSNPPVGTSPDSAERSFPTRTFVWMVQDPDGLETVSRIRYALDDTSHWSYLPGSASSVTLWDISPGFHRFFVQAVDTAGAPSNLLMYPDSADLTHPNGWYVREPRGTVLLVDDYALDNGNTRDFYTSLLDSLVGPDGYSVMEVRDDHRWIPYTQTDQAAWFGYFQVVLWYHYSEAPHLPDADGGLSAFVDNGGDLFVSSLRPDPDYTFISIDSTFVLNPTGRMLSGLEIRCVDPFFTDSTRLLPELYLETDALIARRVSAYYPGLMEAGAWSRDLFILQEPRNAFDAWVGNPPIAQLYHPSPTSGYSIFFSLPFHFCNGRQNVVAVMRYIFTEIFQEELP